MAKQTINIGAAANDKSGDPLRTAFTKINSNFNELYNLVGGTVSELTEIAQDYAAPLLTHSSHTGIAFTYDDANNKLIAVVASQLPSQSGNNGKYLTTNGSTLSWATTPSTDRLVLGTARLVLSDESASRLSLYNSNTEKSRIQQNGNDLLLSSLAGGVTISATDGVGGDWYFNTLGELESSGGKFLSSPEVNATFGSMNAVVNGASSGTVTIKSGSGNVNAGSIFIIAGEGGTGTDGEVVIRTGSLPYEWLFGNGGSLTFPDGTIQLTAFRITNNHSGSSTIQTDGVEATRNNLSVKIIVGAANTLDVQVKYSDPTNIVGVNAYRSVPTVSNVYSGTITKAAGNTTWDTVGNLPISGDNLCFTFVDISFHRIYRVTVIARSMPSTAPGDAYCLIEELK